jgi:hypothetical protein
VIYIVSRLIKPKPQRKITEEKNSVKKWPSITIAGITATGIYLILGIVSYILYPKSYNPIANWLSDLGNPLDNPSGAIYYRLGCILAAIALILFYVELRKLNNGNRRMLILLLIAQVTGIFSSLALIITGIFPLGANTSIHSLWSIMLYIGLAFFEFFSAIVFIRYTKFPKWLAYYGFIAYAINFTTGVFFNKIYFAEWVVVAMLIAYIAMIVSCYKETAKAVFAR